jgi:hypothetical protein
VNHLVADLLENGDRRDACPTLQSQQSAPFLTAWFRLKFHSIPHLDVKKAGEWGASVLNSAPNHG